ncbi:hypothetical protein C0J52_21387 [Blattella germanica]|nr:hypothetical protein C0J52_21387 [Blattella germanica]
MHDNKVEEKAQDESSVTHMPPQTATSMPVNDESFSTLDGVSSSLDDDVNPYIPSESSLPIFSSVEDSLSSSKQMFHDNVQVVQWLSSSGIPYIPSSASMPKFRDNVSDVLIGYVAVESNSDLPYRPSEISLPEFPNNVRDCKEEKRRCATLVGKPSCGLPYVPSISSLPQKIDQTETSKFIFTDDKDTGGNLVSLSPIMNLRKQNQTDAVIEPMNPMKLRMLVRKPSFGIPYTPSLSSLPQQQPLYVKEVFVYDDSPSVVPKLSCEIPYEASVASLPIKAEIKPMDETELNILDIKSSSEIPYVASASSMPHIVHNPSSHDSILQHANLDDHNQTIAKVDVMSSEISNSAHDMIPVSILKSWPVKNVNNTTFKSSNEVHISQKNGGTSEDLPEEKDTVKRLRYSQNATEKCHSIEVKYGPVDQSNNPPDDTVHSDFKGGTNWRNKTGINGKSCPQKSVVNNSYLKTERSVRNATYKLRRVKTSKFRQSKKNLSNSDRWKIRKELNINFSHKKSRYVMISVTKSCPGAIEKSKLTYFNQKKETLRVSSFAETKNFLKSLKAMSDAHILNKQIKDVSQYFTVKELVKKRSVVQFENPVQNCPIIMVAGAGSISGDVSEPEVSAAAVSSTQQPRIDYIDRDTKMPTTIGELIDLIHQVQRDDTQEVCTICGIPNTLYSHQNSKEELTDYGAEGSTSSTPDDNSKESSGSSVTVEKLDAYPRGSHPNSRVSWPPNSRLEEVQSASSSKGTKSRKSQMSRDHNYDDHSISLTTGDHPERLSNQVNQMNEPSRNTQVPNQISESYRGQDPFYSENQSRDTAASFSKHSTSGREPGSVYSERSGSTNNPSDIFHSFPRSSGQQPRQTSIGIAGSMTSQAPSQLPNQSMMGKVFSTSKQSGGKTVSIAPVQPTEQQNACYCRFEKKVNSKFPFPKTVSADVPSASSRFGTLQYSQGRSTQNSLPRTSKFVNAHSVPQAVNTSSRPHSSSGSQMQSSHIHEEKSYAAPTTYVNENGHYSSLQSSREVNQGANPVLMGANGLVAGIQISLIPQHFAYQNTKPTSSFLTGSSNDDNVRNSDTSRVRTTEPGQTNTRRTSRAPIQHTIPSDFKHSQPSYRSSGDSHSVMGGQQPISEESSHQNYRNANVSITKPSVSNERIDLSQRNFGTVSNLPASSQKSIPSKSTINVERDEYPHSNYFSDQLIYNRRYYNSGDISEGDGDALLNGQPQHEKSFGHTSQRIQSYSEPPAPVHILRNSAQGSSFKENSLSQNMAPQGNGSKFTLQLPPFTAESNNVETDNNIISRAIDAVKPICHCRDSADFGIFVTVPCNDDTRERRAFCYQESCPSNCLDSEIPQYPVARHPSETSQLQQTGRWDYPFSNLPAVDTLQYLDHQPEPCSCQPEEFEDHSHNDDVSRNISHRSFTDDHLSGTRSVPVTVIRSGEYPSMIPTTRQPTLLSNAASFGNRVKHIDQPCAATSREAMPQQVYMKDVVDKDQVGVPPSSSSNLDKVLWALAKVSIYDDGTRMFEILEASPIPPGHYFLPENDEE